MKIKIIILLILGLAALPIAIYYGGRFLSDLAERKYRKDIDENGLVINASVSGKKYLKGYYVIFAYEYKGKSYSNKEQSRDYHRSLEISDPIQIKPDTLNPQDSYIFATGHK